MSSLATILASILAGGLAGFLSSYLGPRMLEQWRQKDREKNWAKPRKELLAQLLSGKNRFRSLDILSRVIGVSEEECRNLLIQIDCRALANVTKKEKWALISRAPLKEINSDKEVEDSIQ